MSSLPTIETIKSSFGLIDWQKLASDLKSRKTLTGLSAFLTDGSLYIYVGPEYFADSPERENGYQVNTITIVFDGTGFADPNTASLLKESAGKIAALHFWEDRKKEDSGSTHWDSVPLFGAVLDEPVDTNALLTKAVESFSGTTKEFDAEKFVREVGIIVAQNNSPGYSLYPSTFKLNEGSDLTTEVITTNVDPGTKLYWHAEDIGSSDLLDGFTDEDLDKKRGQRAGLSGFGIVNNSGKFDIHHKIRNDKRTEGPEKFLIKLATDLTGKSIVAQTSEITIFDTSLNAKPTIKTIKSSHVLSGNGRSEQKLLNVINSSFKLSDSDKDPIIAYKIRLSGASNPKKSGSIVGIKGLEIVGNHTSSKLSAAQISKLNYLAGDPGTSNHLSLRVFDGKEWSNWSVPTNIRTNRLPITYNKDLNFLPGQYRKHQRVDRWLGANTYDPDGDQIKIFKIVDWNSASDSGYFLLNNKRPYPEDKIAPFTVKSADLGKLKWVVGAAGTTDPVEITAEDERGDSSTAEIAYWSTTPKTSYSYKSDSGVNHVSEGRSLVLRIIKESNLKKQTSLQYLVSEPSGSITAGIDDFTGLKVGDWKTLKFEPNSKEARISLNTISDNLREGSETARIWIYDSSLDNSEADWLLNPAFKPFDFEIHDRIAYVMGPSSVLAEGETARMSVVRFGGYNQESVVKLDTTSLEKVYKELKGQSGLARPGKDYDRVSKSYTFTADYDMPGKRGDRLLTASARLAKDGDRSETAETFAWKLSRPERKSSGKIRFVVDDLRLVTTVEGASRYKLLSADFFQALFGGITSWFKEVFRDSQPSKNLTAVLAKSRPVSLPAVGSGRTHDARTLTPVRGPKGPVGLVGLDAGSLIGVDAGSLIGVDAGSLIGVDAGSLIGVDAGSLIGVDAGSLIGVDAGSLIATGGTFVSKQAGAGMAGLSMANGVPLIAAGGLN